ncbi:MAG: hypothetical protein HQK60_15290 [Deltaproteobacteria bacterium]|nr:hypothetical protein [Deltaproteobacteria bacterium]
MNLDQLRSKVSETDTCHQCGHPFRPGTTRYVVSMTIVADFDGVLTEPDEDIEGGIDRLLEQLSHADPDQVERDVFEQINVMLCTACKERLASEIREKRYRLSLPVGGQSHYYH